MSHCTYVLIVPADTFRKMRNDREWRAILATVWCEDVDAFEALETLAGRADERWEAFAHEFVGARVHVTLTRRPTGARLPSSIGELASEGHRDSLRELRGMIEPGQSSMRIDVAGIGVDALVVGGGPEPVLFVHGLGASRSCWERAPEYLDLDRYTLVFPDLPGFGASDQPEAYDYELSSLATSLHAVLVYLRIDAVHVVAHSMGGAVALLLAGRPGLRVRSFLAAEGNLVAGDAFMSSKVARLKESLFVRVYSKWIATVRQSLEPEFAPIHEQFIESLRQAAPYAVHRASVSCAKVTASNDLSDRFARLECPRGYIVGARTDREIAPVVREVATDIMTVAGQGHFMMGDADRFYPLVRGFLARVTKG